MKVHVHLDLYKLANIGASFNEVNFTDITEKVGFYEDYQEVKRLRVRYVGGSPQIDYYNVDLLPIPSGSLIGNDVMLLSDIRPTSILSSIEFFAEYDNATNLKALITAGVITLGITGYTVIELYRLNDKRNVLSKSKTFIGYIDGQFKNPISIKNFSIDVVDYPLTTTYNYVYIPKLKRYYYVNDVAFVSKDLTRINLVEDVLSSWESLIRTQSAFVTRQESSSNVKKLSDQRLPVEDFLTYDYYDIVHSASSLENITFNFMLDDYYATPKVSVKNILVNTYTKDIYTLSSRYKISAPTGTGLNDISALKPIPSFMGLISLDDYRLLNNACVKDDTTASFVTSAIWLPFDPSLVIAHPQTNQLLHANDKVLTTVNGGEWITWGSQPEGTNVDITMILDGGLPYLISDDFYFNSTWGITPVTNNAGIEIYEPISTWEIWVTFVGWVQVDITKVRDKHILIMYALDTDTGIAIAYIYNMSDKIVVWSGTCQMGIRLNFATSNELENTRQKQANDLNMILGAVGSALSIGVGAVSSNPIAIAGGVLSASKTIANAVNSNNQLFDRASISIGTSNTALYLPRARKIRRSYHKPLTIESTTYAKLQGYPANYYTSLSSITGYTEIGDIQFNASNNDIYNVEIDEIVALLKSGVIM